MASSSAGSIYVDLLLRDANYVAGLRRAGGQTNSVVNTMKTQFGSLAGSLAAAFSAREIIRYTDAFRQMQGRLSLVTNSMSQLKGVQQGLLDVANRTRQPLQDVTNFYSRLAQFVPEAERAQYDLLGVTENVAAALAVTGETSESAGAAMVQFTQAIGTNFEAAGQELRSLQEQAPRLTKALMNAIGDGTQSLQQLKDAGKLSRESVLNALSGMGEEGKKLREELAKLPVTVGQSLTILNNEFFNLIGNSGSLNTATQALADSIAFLGRNLSTIVDIGAALAAVYGVRVASAFVAAQIQAVAYQAALARMAGVSLIVETRVLAMNRALAFFGGPIGLAITGVATATYLLAQRTTELERAQIAGNQAEQNAMQIAMQLSTARGQQLEITKRARDEVIRDAQASVENARAKLQEANAIYEVVKAQNARAGAGGLWGGVAEGVAGSNASEAAELLKNSEESLARVKDALSNIGSVKSSGAGTSAGGGKSSKKSSDELGSLYKQYEQYIRGVTNETLRLEEAEASLMRLRDAGRITQEQMTSALEAYRNELQYVADETVDWQEMSKQAARNIQDSFANFLFDPFQDGVNGMVKGFVDAIRRMIAEQAAASLFGGGGGGGFLGSLMGSQGWISRALSGGTYGPLPSFGGFFADGGFIEPGQWGIVGENGPEIAFGGNTGKTIIPQNNAGGNITYNIDARGADKEAISKLRAELYARTDAKVFDAQFRNSQRRGAFS